MAFDPKPNISLYPATTPQRLPGRSRACGFWISWAARDDTGILVDTRHCPEELTKFNPAGDRIPHDTLLVIISPERQAEIVEKAVELPYPVSGPFLASLVIDELCRERPGLADRIEWYTLQ